MSFGTAINCMDGRVQDSVATFLRERFGVKYVDMITDAGPVARVAEGADAAEDLLRRVAISREAHDSTQIAVAAHSGCAGNPVSEEIQRDQLSRARAVVRELHPECEVIALWVADGQVTEL